MELLKKLIELNKKAIDENWKMEEVGEQFFKIFAYNNDGNVLTHCVSKTDMIKFLQSVFQQDNFDYEKAYQDWQVKNILRKTES